MGMTLTFTANDPQATALTVLDGAGGGPWHLMPGTNWGNAVWDTAYTGPRGTLGARPTSAQVGNRQVMVNLRLLPASVTAASTHLAELQLVVDRMRRYGGTVTYKPSGRTYRQHLEVYAGAANMADWVNRAEHLGRFEVACGFTCSPYVLGDPMLIVDDFTVDTTGNYVFDDATAAGFAISDGGINTSGANLSMFHTAVGYDVSDSQTAVTFTVPAGLTNLFVAAFVKRTGPGTTIGAVLNHSGGTTLLQLRKREAGSFTTYSSTGGTAIASGNQVTVVARTEGNTLYGEIWINTEPTLGGTATTAATYTLSGSDIDDFGEGVAGAGGFLIGAGTSPQPTITRFEHRPYVYRGANFTGWSAPDEYRLDGDIPGDAPALASVEVAGEGVSSDHTRFGMLAWSRRPAVHNLVADGGDFEMAITGSPGTVAGPWWTVAGVTGVTGAATSQTRTAGGRYGGWCNQIVCPATANTGVACAVYRRFRAGVTYTAEAWVRAASATTNTRIRLGVSGDIASETAAALTSGWVKRTVTWTPTATTHVAYFAAEITAATATTFQLDGVRVYEGTTAPTAAAQAQGYGGRPPFGIVDAGEAYWTSFMSLTTGASTTDYHRGRYLDWGAGATGAGILIDPTLIPTDDHATGLDVEVWALGYFPATETFTAFLQPWGENPVNAPTKGTGKVWTREYGSGGITIPTGAPLYGWLRLGTLPLNPQATLLGADDPAPVLLVIYGTVNTDTLVTAVALVPSRSRALSPTNKTDDTDYPRFSINTDGYHRKFTADLQGLYRPASSPWRQGPGLGGALIELEPGPVDMVLAASQYIPGTTSSSITKYRQTTALAVTPTPRWHHLRDE